MGASPPLMRDIHCSVNIANAALFGLKTDLNLGGNEYNTALVILCVGLERPVSVY